MSFWNQYKCSCCLHHYFPTNPVYTGFFFFVYVDHIITTTLHLFTLNFNICFRNSCKVINYSYTSIYMVTIWTSSMVCVCLCYYLWLRALFWLKCDNVLCKREKKFNITEPELLIFPIKTSFCMFYHHPLNHTMDNTWWGSYWFFNHIPFNWAILPSSTISEVVSFDNNWDKITLFSSINICPLEQLPFTLHVFHFCLLFLSPIKNCFPFHPPLPHTQCELAIAPTNLHSASLGPILDLKPSFMRGLQVLTSNFEE